MTEPAEHHGEATMLDAALAYARRGWRVVPVPAGRKVPTITAWQREGTTDEARIRHWWTQAPTHGIGIVCGAASGLWVLDVDVAGDKQGDDTLAELVAAYGALPDTYTVITGSGGQHIAFRWDPAHPVRNSASGVLGPGLDVRGEGGFVVAPPSLHANGNRYTVEASAPDHLAPGPPWLYGLLERRDTPSTPRTPTSVAGDRPGDLWAAQTPWMDLLIADGWTQLRPGPGGEERWCRPGKDPREGPSATVGHKGSDVLKVFTSSHPQLRADETYTKLGYLAATRFDGNHGDAARWLRSQGFGSDDRTDPADLIATPAPVDPDAPWDTPTPLVTAPKPAPFPVEALPAWIGEQVLNVAQAIQCDPALPGTAALGALSVAAIGNAEIRTRVRFHDPLAVYLVTVAEVSAGKSPAQSAMLAPIRAHETRMVASQSAERARASSRRKIAEKQANTAEDAAALTGDPDKITKAIELRVAAEMIDQPHEGRLIISDITPERVASIMVANRERMAIISDEPEALQMDRYGDSKNGRKMNLYLQAWSGEGAKVDRQNGTQITLNRPVLTMIVASQPGPWASIMADAELRERGFLQRIMADAPAPVGPRDHDLDRDTRDEEIDERYEANLGQLADRLAAYGSPLLLTLSTDARRAWRSWANAIERRMTLGGDLETEKGWGDKMLRSVTRVAGLLHLAEHHDATPMPTEVSADTLQRAILVGDYWVAHRLRMIDDVTSSSEPMRLLAALVRLADGDPDAIVTYRDIGRGGPRKMRKREVFAPVLATLVEHGWARLVGDAAVQGMVAIDRAAAARGVQMHPDAVDLVARQCATRATNPTQGGGVTCGNDGERDLSRVSRVSPESWFSDPLSSTSAEMDGEGRATRATAPDPPPVDNPIPAGAWSAFDVIDAERASGESVDVSTNPTTREDQQ